MEIIESPCTRNCCLDENDICVGCLRSMEEILRWTKMSNAEKVEVIERCNNKKASDQII